MIFDVLAEVLSEAGIELKDVNVIACTEQPGLIPSLLVGLTVAKTLSHLLAIPYLPINHIEGHMFANYLDRDADAIPFPAICLTVSG